MVEKPYEFLESYTADIGFIAYGETIEELFSNAAKALIEIQTDIKTVSPKTCIEIKVSGYDILSLVRNWLEELLFLRDAESLFFSHFEILNIKYDSSLENPWSLQAKACGEKIDPNRHPSKVEVKAVSYYDMEFCQKGFTYMLKVLVDI